MLLAMLERGGKNAGDQRMRVLAVIALAMLLAGCNGDRIKQSENPPQGIATSGTVASSTTCV
jgi:hypothetical protein